MDIPRYPTLIHERVDLARRGENPTVICRMPSDWTVPGEALSVCTETFRINYEILGNADAVLHAHVFPRYRHEPDEYRSAPVWSYPAATRTSVQLNTAMHCDLQKHIVALPHFSN